MNFKGLSQPHILAVLLLGISSGIPLMLTSSTLQAWFTQAGTSVLAIGALSLVGLPYLCKPLWAPLLDRFTLPWGERRRGWIAVTQIILCLALLLLANSSPQTQILQISILALVIAFFSASQDIVFDAYRTELLQPQERGLGAAASIFGYRLAILITGGGALVLADHIGWKMTYELMALLMAISILITIKAPKTPYILPPNSFKAAIIDPFRDLLSRERIGFILAFILLYKIGDAFATSLMSMFLLRTLEFSLTDVGVVYKIVGLIATIMGAFLGGLWLVSLNLYRALLIFGIMQAIANLMLVVLAMVGKNYSVMISTIFMSDVCNGMTTAAFVAFLMSICNEKYTATQFACLSALAAVGRVISGPIAASIIGYLGWVNFYWFSFFLSLPGILLINFLKEKVSLNEKVVQS